MMNNLKERLTDIGKKIDFSDLDLHKIDLTRKYDEGFSDADGIALRDHILLYAIAAVVFLFIIWASFFSIDEVARGNGRVIPSSEVQVIQNLEGGIVDALLVKEGDIVDAGQVLVRLRNVQAKSEFEASNKKYYALLSMTARLSAEAEGRDPAFTDEMRQNAPESVATEEAAFAANKTKLQQEQAILQEQLTQQQQKKEELIARISDLENVLKLTRQEREMLAPLVTRGSASKQELLQLDRSIASQETDLNGYKVSLPRSDAMIKEAEGQLAAQINTFKAEAQRQLSERTAEMNTVKETLTALKDKSERTEITSPVHGVVKQMKIMTIGGVARPGEPIMDIVPLDDQLLIEAQIKPSDIAFIVDGQKAVVRITAYDFSMYGALDGEVVEVSPDSITTEKGESFYRVKVRTSKTKLVRHDKEYSIIPGMQSTVDVITGKRTVMQYLLKPLIKASETALTER